MSDNIQSTESLLTIIDDMKIEASSEMDEAVESKSSVNKDGGSATSLINEIDDTLSLINKEMERATELKNNKDLKRTVRVVYAQFIGACKAWIKSLETMKDSIEMDVLETVENSKKEFKAISSAFRDESAKLGKVSSVKEKAIESMIDAIVAKADENVDIDEDSLHQFVETSYLDAYESALESLTNSDINGIEE